MTLSVWGLLAATAILLATCLWLAWRLRAYRQQADLELAAHTETRRALDEAVGQFNQSESAAQQLQLQLSATLASTAATLEQTQRQLAQSQAEAEQLHAKLEESQDAVAEANRTKGLFIANMSHELRTPLNGILGLTRSLLDSPLTSRQQSEVELIQLAGEDLMRIVNDILDLSKLEASKLTLEEIPFHLGELLEGVFRLLYPQAARKHLSYALTYSPAMRLRYLGDPFRIRQVVLNLLSNAIKFTQSGHVFLDTVETRDEDGSALVHFHFEDSGIGINTEKQRLIFEEFQQADLSTTRRFGGTGLGLSLSRRIVDLMGGTIELDSEPGRGSRFTISIPLTPIEALDQRPTSDTPSQLHTFHGVRLLVQQRHSSETIAFLRLVRAVPGLEIQMFDQASEFAETLNDGERPSWDAVVTAASALSVWDEHTVQSLRRLGSAAPPLIVLRDHPQQNQAPARHPLLETVNLDLPVLPSHLFGLLKRLRNVPLGPLFEAAGMTLFDLYSGSPPPRVRNGVLLLANDNPVELLRLEGIARKLGLEWRSASSTKELAQLIHTETLSAAVVQSTLLTTEAQVALWRTASDNRPPVRLIVTGALDAVTRSQLSASPVSYQVLVESPRLAQVKAALSADGGPSPSLPTTPSLSEGAESYFSEG